MTGTNFQLCGDGETIKEIGAQPPLAIEHISAIDESPEFMEIPNLAPFLEKRTPAGGNPYTVLDLEKLQEAMGDRLVLQPESLVKHMRNAMRKAGFEADVNDGVRPVDRQELMFGAKAWTTT